MFSDCVSKRLYYFPLLTNLVIFDNISAKYYPHFTVLKLTPFGLPACLYITLLTWHFFPNFKFICNVFVSFLSVLNVYCVREKFWNFSLIFCFYFLGFFSVPMRDYMNGSKTSHIEQKCFFLWHASSGFTKILFCDKWYVIPALW